MKKCLSALLVVIMLFSLTISVFAAKVVPSVEAKTAPEIHSVVIRGSDGKESPIPEDSYIIIIPFAEATGNIKENLEESKISFEEVEDVAALCAEVEAVVAELVVDGSIETKDLEVTDLFDVQVSNDIIEYLAQNEDASVVVRFATNKSEIPVIMYRCDGDTDWKVLPSESVSLKDGMIEARFTEFCNVAFLYAATEEPAAKSPCYWWLLIVLIVILIIIAVICYYRSKKEAEKNAKEVKEAEQEENKQEETAESENTENTQGE